MGPCGKREFHSVEMSASDCGSDMEVASSLMRSLQARVVMRGNKFALPPPPGLACIFNFQSIQALWPLAA